MQTCTPTNFTETKYQHPTSWEKYSNCSPAIQKMKYSTCCKALKDISITWIPGQKKRSSKYLRMDKGIYISTLISTLLTRYKNKVLLSKAAHFLFPALRVLEICRSSAIVGCEDSSFWSSFLTEDLMARQYR